jgi:hypothetical protein
VPHRALPLARYSKDTKESERTVLHSWGRAHVATGGSRSLLPGCFVRWFTHRASERPYRALCGPHGSYYGRSVARAAELRPARQLDGVLQGEGGRHQIPGESGRGGRKRARSITSAANTESVVENKVSSHAPELSALASSRKLRQRIMGLSPGNIVEVQRYWETGGMKFVLRLKSRSKVRVLLV